MDKEFNGEEIAEFRNSWWLTPVAWDILFDKYIPKKPWEEKRSFLSASMFDNTVFRILNEKINNSHVQEDRVLWELGNQQVFFTKDKDFVADCISNFLTTNSDLAIDLGGNHIHARFAEVAGEVRNLDTDKHPYFIFKNTSCDDGVEYWFRKYDEVEEDSVPRSLKEMDERVTEFVVIEKDRIVKFIGNTDYFKQDE